MAMSSKVSSLRTQRHTEMLNLPLLESPRPSYNPQSAKTRAATHEGVLGMIPLPWNLPSCQLVSTANNVVAGQHKGRTILLFRWTIPSGKGQEMTTSGSGKSNTGAILPHPFLALPFRPSVAAIYEVVVV